MECSDLGVSTPLTNTDSSDWLTWIFTGYHFTLDYVHQGRATGYRMNAAAPQPSLVLRASEVCVFAWIPLYFWLCASGTCDRVSDECRCVLAFTGVACERSMCYCKYIRKSCASALKLTCCCLSCARAGFDCCAVGRECGLCRRSSQPSDEQEDVTMFDSQIQPEWLRGCYPQYRKL